MTYIVVSRMIAALVKALYPNRTNEIILEQFARDYPSESFYFIPKEFRADVKERLAMERARRGIVFREVYFGDTAPLRHVGYRADLAAGVAVRVEDDNG